MARLNILVAGDSFSSTELSGDFGWPKQLAHSFSVTNVSRPGIGQYKILQNIKNSLSDSIDLVIVSHTSSNRVHCETNPLYPKNHIYYKSDMIFADVESKLPVSKSYYDYFCHVFDPEYYNFVHHQCCKEIVSIIDTTPVIHMTHFNWTGLYPFSSLINFHDLWKQNSGSCVHYNEHGNQVILDTLTKQIHQLFPA
jgi:hypothetical protein